MPTYNFEEANEHYFALKEAKENYNLLGRTLGQILLLGVKISEKDKDSINLAVDEYIYWSSAANIQLFYAKYDEMDESIKKVNLSLDKFKDILAEIINKNNL